MSPALIASLMTTSRRSFAEAAPKHLQPIASINMANLAKSRFVELLIKTTRDLHRVSRIKKTPCTLHSDQRVFFNAQISQVLKESAIPCEVRVTIAKARHQRPPLTMENTHSGILFQLLDVWYFTHSGKVLPCSKIKPHGEHDYLGTLKV